MIASRHRNFAQQIPDESNKTFVWWKGDFKNCPAYERGYASLKLRRKQITCQLYVSRTRRNRGRCPSYCHNCYALHEPSTWHHTHKKKALLLVACRSLRTQTVSDVGNLWNTKKIKARRTYLDIWSCFWLWCHPVVLLYVILFLRCGVKRHTENGGECLQWWCCDRKGTMPSATGKAGPLRRNRVDPSSRWPVMRLNTSWVADSHSMHM